MQRQVAITTIDNPFDPFDDFVSWFLFDIEKGYYTSSKLARITEIPDGSTDTEELYLIEQSIDRLIEIDPLKIYKKVEKIEETQ